MAISTCNSLQALHSGGQYWDKIIKKNLLWPSVPRGESTTTVCGVNYQQLAVMQLTQPNWLLLVAVDHSQPRIMESETVDPIDQTLPVTLARTVPLERHLHDANACRKSQCPCQESNSVSPTQCRDTSPSAATLDFCSI